MRHATLASSIGVIQMYMDVPSETSVNLKKLRITLSMGGLLILSFIGIDLLLLPEVLHQAYYISRLGMQFPFFLTLYLLTFLSNYNALHKHVLWLGVLGITYANFWLLVQCWTQAGLVFAWEGTLLYGLFGMFILRINFIYSLMYAVLSLVGFAWIIIHYPMYGELGSIKFGFLLCGFAVSLVGVKQIESGFKRFQQVNKKLLYLNQIDPLTELYNRGAMEQNFQRMLSIAARTNTRISVFIVDLDNFKDFNDGYGHLRGDDVIQLQAQILRQIFNRETDMVARFGGEEFVVVSLGNTTAESEAQAARVLAAWQQNNVAHGKGKGQRIVSCSIGLINTEVDKSTEKERLFEMADSALYEAKNSGRARYVSAISCELAPA